METERLLAQLLSQYENTPGGLLPLLHAIQEDLGYIPPESIPSMAEVMNLSVAEVHGVISFYHDFKTSPGGRHTLQICAAESCQAAGGKALAQLAQEQLGIEFGETADDGSVTLEKVYCLGNCACSPSIRIDNETYARLDATRLKTLIETISDGGGAS